MPSKEQLHLQLFNFLVGSFTVEKLRQIVQFTTPELAPELPTGSINLSEFAAQYVAVLARNKRLDRAFFDTLAQFWKGPREEIEALKQAFGASASRRAKPEERATAASPSAHVRTYRHFCIILDRSIPWSAFKGRCVRADWDCVFLVHAGHDQDLYLFLERVARFISDKRDELGFRDHTHLAVRCKDARGYPESAGEWGGRLREAVARHLNRDLADLADALRALTEHSAAILALHGADGQGLRVGGTSPLPPVSRIALVKFLRQDLPPLLELRRKHPLRLLIPVEHEPYTHKPLPPDILFSDVHGALEGKPWYLRVPELAVPDWPDVLKTIEAVMLERAGYTSGKVCEECHRAYESGKRKKHGFAALADALGTILDRHFPDPSLTSVEQA